MFYIHNPVVPACVNDQRNARIRKLLFALSNTLLKIGALT